VRIRWANEQKRSDSMADAVKTWSFALSRSGRREEMSGRVEDRSGFRASSRSSMCSLRSSSMGMRLAPSIVMVEKIGLRQAEGSN